ncbi:hypothetical protein GDO86_000622 [Hymenochirus boettgeri]|uniref:Alpha-type protein kinase domain-containing protein n=1 Tax=Hymenochirus boettgeri TaxID=247094 RepID=A0A8T2KDV5_9PIPI|nr:hypothetical protein GDO86_000622 [Hymenochirus boettgeri]
MNNQEVVTLLQECKQMLSAFASGVSELSEKEKNDYQQCEASIPDDLKTLIQEAKEMKWPFVPERWQYKQAVGPEDKTNLQDIINPRLHDLLGFLKASIAIADSATAAAIVFLIDRILYWADASIRLLQVAKALHKMWPATPIAPQVVIRQARISVNTGKLLKAEYILSSLINNNGETGFWQYTEESDKVLVQSVCIQIRGQILQKLGMWYEAAELIWVSIVGFSELPIPDKKGISSSMGILADIFISMSKEDYQRFTLCSHVCLSLLEEFDHKLLSAAESCKLAATFSLYTPLFVLVNLTIRGTCLLSYSLSKDCPMELKPHYLSEAKEAFEIGLLTKQQEDLVSSKQELNFFVKSAFCLANVHKWLNSDSVNHKDVHHLCTEAVKQLAIYNTLPDKQDKANLARDIMSIVFSLKESLRVQQFSKIDKHSYVPESYKECVKKKLVNGNIRFQNLLDMHSRHHSSVCQVLSRNCRRHICTKSSMNTGACITATVLNTLDGIRTGDDISGDHDSLHQSSNARRCKLVRSNAVSFSSDEENQKIRLQLMSNSSSSSKSWCSLSNASSSWESVGFNNENELSNELNSSKGSNENDFPVVAHDILCENESQENDDFVNIHMHNLSIQERNETLYPNIQMSTEEPCSVSASPFSSLNNHLNKSTLKSEDHCSRFFAEPATNRDDQSEGSVLFEDIDYLAETESATHEIHKISEAKKDNHVCTISTVDPDCETEDNIENKPVVIPSNDFNGSTCSSKHHTLFNCKHSSSLPDDACFLDQTTAANNEGKIPVLQQQCSTGSSSQKKSSEIVKHSPETPETACETTEEGDRFSLSSSHGSNSWKNSRFSRSSSGSFSLLNSSASSYVFIQARNTEQARLLSDMEYENLLSGVEHDWLMERLQETGVFNFTHLHQAYDALLLKFSKKSGLWIAQETIVHCGDYVEVSKKGRQRNIFWVQFLHQDNSLARYVGKEYKEPKELLYHFSDVERQMTAQYYVTEFNKRLYELNILTQIFYIPSSILLILEDRCIKGGISVEPYILGEFVKLSNNAHAVKTQFEATKYGLAFGHFTYEFSNYSDIVVDLQGWVTASKKGEALIYLTDPQIHSVNNNTLDTSNKSVPACINFGKKGVEYFFNSQHTECNEICYSLSLTRPDLTTLQNH